MGSLRRLWPRWIKLGFQIKAKALFNRRTDKTGALFKLLKVKSMSIKRPLPKSLTNANPRTCAITHCLNHSRQWAVVMVAVVVDAVVVVAVDQNSKQLTRKRGNLKR